MKDTTVSFETAKLAKEKGFNIPCSKAFHVPSKTEVMCFTSCTNEDDIHYSAPTQSLLQKWLREIHNIDVHPICNYHYKLGKQYHLGIIFINNNKKVDTIIIKENDKSLDTINRHYNSYEGALEEGLQEALKLIKK